MINDFFNWCVLVLEIMAEYIGMSYELINILIFVILQPLLIVIFFICGVEKDINLEKSVIFMIFANEKNNYFNITYLAKFFSS